MERIPFDQLSREELIGLTERLFDCLSESERRNAELMKRLEDQARRIDDQAQRIEELEKRHPTVRLDESYSMRAEERRQAEASGKKHKQKSNRRGRISTAEKLAQAMLEEDVWPSQFPREDCQWKYSRPVWRIINGQAVRVAYHIYAGSDGRVPQIPGVPKRGEFGREIIVSLAYQHYLTGLPLDTVLGEFSFYWGLKLPKSQADTMLNRLAKEWLPEFDALCQLLAVSAVVYADETSWSINSVWTFLSEKARVTVFGCHKDGETLEVLLKKDGFQGVVVSDDAAVYQGFSRAQKCWAHLIRKAIRLTLLKPDRRRYRQFLDALLDIYRRGKAIAADKRLNEAGRRARVEQLVAAICDCTGNRFCDASTPSDEAEHDFFNLTHEIVRLLGEDELFIYAIHPEVSGTNNESERTLRQPAQDRDTGQTNKTASGARRRTVIASVLDSLRVHLPQLTLQTVLTEINTWYQNGVSCFRRMVNSLNLPQPRLPDNVQSPLELLVPITGSS
jgi:transposase